MPQSNSSVYISTDGTSSGHIWVKQNQRWRSLSESQVSSNYTFSSTSANSEVDTRTIDQVKVKHVLGRFLQKILISTKIPELRNNTTQSKRQSQPYCIIPKGNQSNYATFGEIIRILNFSDAIYDLQTRNYVFTLAEMVIFTPVSDVKKSRTRTNPNGQNEYTSDTMITFAMSLGGQAQENFYDLLKEIVNYCKKNDNFERLRILKFLEFLLACLDLNKYSFQRPLFPTRFVGCRTLWVKRFKMVGGWISELEELGAEKSPIRERALACMQQQRSSSSRKTSLNTPYELNINTVPYDIRYKIKKSLSNGDDVNELNSTFQCYQNDANLYPKAEEKIWQSLVQYNFKKFLSFKNPKISWKQTYTIFSIKYARENRDVVSSLLLCKECNCLYWKMFGHPHVEGRGRSFVMVGPRELIVLCKS